MKVYHMLRIADRSLKTQKWREIFSPTTTTTRAAPGPPAVWIIPARIIPSISSPSDELGQQAGRWWRARTSWAAGRGGGGGGRRGRRWSRAWPGLLPTLSRQTRSPSAPVWVKKRLKTCQLRADNVMLEISCISNQQTLPIPNIRDLPASSERMIETRFSLPANVFLTPSYVLTSHNNQGGSFLHGKYATLGKVGRSSGYSGGGRTNFVMEHF